jgi:uncharacterized RDD family membrane protein YckC
MSPSNIFCNKCGTANAPGVQFCSNCGTSLAPLSAGGSPAQGSAGSYQTAGYAPARARAAQYGGFWIRFVAFIIDTIVVQIVVFPISLIFMMIGGISSAVGGASRDVLLSSMWITGIGVRALFGFVLNWLYEAFMESSSRQATLGKMIFSLKVTDLYGHRISFGRATGRHFAKYLSGFILMIGYIMAGFTERKQALHDMIAGTLVQKA